MQYFMTDWSFPPIVQVAPRVRGYRRTVRYGHARLGRGTSETADSAPTLTALPRVQAVVDAVLAARETVAEAA
jgi:hypothetical protein